MISIEVHDDVNIVRLNRPAKRNSMTPDMLQALDHALKECDSKCAVVLSGVGDVFCAGFDLALCRDDRTVLAALLRGLSECLASMRMLSVPIVLSAHGAAVAGGCALLAGADFVITNRDAKLGYPVLKLGISPAVNLPFLRQAVKDGTVRSKTLEPELFSGTRALSIGLVHEVVDSVEACEPRAIELARELGRKPSWAVSETKRWLREIAPLNGIDAALGASIALVDGEEERRMLPKAWSRA